MEAQRDGQVPVFLRREPEAASDAERSLRSRVVVTGLGVVAPSGVGVDRFWQALVDAESCVTTLDRFDTSRYPVRIAAPVRGLAAERASRREPGRFRRLAVAATRQAVEDSGLPADRLASPHVGLVLGTAAGAIEVGESQAVRFAGRGPRAVHPAFPALISPHSGAVDCASALGMSGPIATISSDCPSGLDAVALACRQIQSGAVNVALAGAADAPLTPMLFAGFARSGMLAAAEGDAAAAASRPFDRSRSGFVLAEGAAMLVLERADLALGRGARVYGEIVGCGVGRDRPEYVGGGDPDGQAYHVAALHALSEGGVSVSNLGLVSAHALGMPLTDRAEMRALQALLGSQAASVPVTSIKGTIGHPLAAAGVLQIVSALLAMQHGFVPPTANCRTLDSDCRLDVVRHVGRRVKPRTALVTSHGFGGNGTAIALRVLPDALR